MILEPGTFNVATYRKAIPSAVKIQSLLNWVAKRGAAAFVSPEGEPCSAADIQFDHDPALTNRPYDTIAADFIPPQNDPNHIFPVRKHIHLEKTTGRKADASVTVTTRGSDVGERSRTQDIRARDAVHRARLAVKAGRQDEADAILAGARFKKKHTRPKSKIPQRKQPWGNGKRSFPKRKMGA